MDVGSDRAPTSNEDNMSKYQYTHGFVSHRTKGGFALIPDVVVNDQRGWDASRRSFPAIPCDACGRVIGASFRAVLRGDLYGLHTTGTGDCVVSNA